LLLDVVGRKLLLLLLQAQIYCFSSVPVRTTDLHLAGRSASHGDGRPAAYRQPRPATLGTE